jgi:hypothetical protein
MKTFILQNYAGVKIGEVTRKTWAEVEEAVDQSNNMLRNHYDLDIIDRSFLENNIVGFIKGDKSTLSL